MSSTKSNDRMFLPYDPFKTVRRPVLIDDVAVEVRDRVYLNVQGVHLDGSGVPVKVEQRRVGHCIKVRIYREWDFDAVCPANRLPYEAVIPLEVDAGLRGQRCKVDINHHVIEVCL